jgi:C4-dicarboxylate transporter DctQ subunit
MEKFAKRLIDALLTLQKYILIISFIIMTIALLADVVGREVFSRGIFGALAFAVFFMVYATFSGLPLATNNGSHLRPRILDKLIPKVLEPVVKRISNIISAVILGYLAFVSIGFIKESILYEDRSIELDWLVWPVQVAIPMGLGIAALMYLLYCIFPDLEPDSDGEGVQKKESVELNKKEGGA